MGFEVPSEGGDSEFNPEDIGDTSPGDSMGYEPTGEITADEPTEGPVDYDDDPAQAETGLERLLPFRQPFDGTQTPPPIAEQKAAGGVFSDFADSITTQNNSRGALFGSAYEGDHYISISVLFSSEPIPHAKNPTLVTVVHADRLTGDVEESSSYRLQEDGSVKRLDSSRAQLESREALRADLPPLPEWYDTGIAPQERFIIRGKHIQWSIRMEEARKMDEAYGFANQPVGTDEIQALIDYVRTTLDLQNTDAS